MANDYCDTSSMVDIPPDKREQAQAILQRVEEELKGSPDEGYVGYLATLENEGVWIRSDESITPHHVEMLVRALVEELDLPGLIVVSWSYTCSKFRINHFGGGAFAIAKGRETIYSIAVQEVREKAKALFGIGEEGRV